MKKTQRRRLPVWNRVRKKIITSLRYFPALSAIWYKPSGVIYILTNPSFPDYVKIGYADDMKTRLAQLNRSECTPFAFRVYATYEVSTRLTDMKLHSIIDRLNPNLRAIDNVDGKKRVREFYAMTAEDAYSLFEAMAEMHGTMDKLKLAKPTKKEVTEEKIAYKNAPSVVCTVVGDRTINYNGEVLADLRTRLEAEGKYGKNV